MSGFQDHFSHDPAGYAAHRPRYPDALFAWLAEQAPARATAWDCATGSGQAALGLAAHFDRVVATDASPQQLAHATPHPRVEYRVAPAEASGLPSASIDLVTVAQAAHWFDLARFYSELRRVVRPGGLVALWGYERLLVDAGVDAVIERFYTEQLAGCWPPERRHVETAYSDLDFPFRPCPTPGFAMTAVWGLTELLGYVGTWSAVQRYRQLRSVDPMPGLMEDLRKVWGSPGTRKVIKWPLFMRLGRV